MANADSNTITHSQSESAISTLLKTPLGASKDLFQIIEGCQCYVDALTENDNNTECMALCGRLLAGLEVSKSVLQAPLPQALIDRLTVTESDSDAICPLVPTDSETLRKYCSALTMLLLNQQETDEQKNHIIGMLFEMVNLLADDLKAPRKIFVGRISLLTRQHITPASRSECRPETSG